MQLLNRMTPLWIYGNDNTAPFISLRTSSHGAGRKRKSASEPVDIGLKWRPSMIPNSGIMT